MIGCVRKGNAMGEDEGKEINNEPPPSNATDDKGPTEQLRDDEKSETGVLVPEESGVPGVQKPGNAEIKDEKGLNTE
jgi:hypothetical protein